MTNPAGAPCELGGFFCYAQFPVGTPVSVAAAPAKGFAFSGFGGDCNGPACTLTMDADKAVTVDFVRFAPLGKLKLDTRKGTAVLVVRVGGPGTLVIKGRRIERREAVLTEDANVKLPVVARGDAAAALAKRGLAKVGAKVSFTPAAGTTASFSRKLWLHRSLS